MRVIHASCYVDPLGRSPRELLEAWPTLTEVAAAAAGDGVEVEVVQAAVQDDDVSWNGVTCHFVADYRRPWWSRGRAVPRVRPARLTAAIASRRPDLVHLHGLRFVTQAEFIGRHLGGVPILIQDHADRPGTSRNPFRRLPQARGVAGVSFTSRDQAAPFVEAGVLGRDIPVFEILESSTDFAPGDQDAARQETGLDGDPCLIWVGRLASVKDPLTVLQAVSEAAHHLPDVRLWCAYTDAPLLRAVQRRVAEDPRLADRVRLLGAVPHSRVEVLLRAADFLILGSRTEGSGYAVIEALACGTTPLVTDIPAFRRITAGGEVGALSPSGDATAMAAEVVSWAQRDRQALRRRARAHFQRALSFEAIGQDLRGAYRQLVSAA